MNEIKRKLTIFGRSYSVMTDRSQEDIERAVEVIEQRYKEISSTDLPVPEEKRLVLLALDLGLVVVDKEREKEKLINEIDALTKEVEKVL